MDEDRYFPEGVEIVWPPQGIHWWRRALAAAPAIAVGAFVIGCLCLAPYVGSTFDAMLGGEPLPLLTEFCLRWWWVGLALMALFSVMGAVAGWRRDIDDSGVIADASILLMLVIAAVFCLAMHLPMYKIIDHLGG